jgi:predicted ester cyclase
MARPPVLFMPASFSRRPAGVFLPRRPLGFPKDSGGSFSSVAMTNTGLSDIYRDYIACLNQQDWPKLGQFVDDEADYNGRRIGLSGYREMLEGDFGEIPDLYFNVHLLISDPPYVASRLKFDCTPKGRFLGLDLNGKRVSFTENVFYQFRGGKISQVWSLIDKAAIEAQL